MTASRPYLLACVLVAAIGMAGCSSAPIASSVISANRAQEEAANKLLLLNIARAHERMPMHFSLMSQIRSGPGGWALGVPGLSLDIPFGGAAKPEFGLSTSLDGQTPVDVTPLTSQEFMRGMTEPMKAEVLGFFVRQGWSPSMLMYLTFEAIEIVKDKAVVRRFINDPRDPSFPGFAKFVADTTQCDVVTTREASPPEFYSTRVTTLSPDEAAKAKQAGLSVFAVDDQGEPVDDAAKGTGLRLGTVSFDAVIRLKNRPSPSGSSPAQCDLARAGPGEPRLITRAGPLTLRPSAPAVRDLASMPSQGTKSQRLVGDTKAGEEEAVFIMRSPQSMIYYLGELSRFQNELDNGVRRNPVTFMHEGGRPSILFRMSNRADVADPAVTVDYAGQTFAVSNFHRDEATEVTDRSVTVLSLMMLIVGLQDKGLTAPAVSNVRLLR